MLARFSISLVVVAAIFWLAAFPGPFADSAQFGFVFAVLLISLAGFSYKFSTARSQQTPLLKNKYLSFVVFSLLALAACTSRAPQIAVLAASITPLTSIVNERAECFSRSSDPSSEAAPKQIGVVEVIQCEKDARGGFYFLTHSTGVGLSPDAKFFGFTYRPNLTGSPFGRANYKTHHLFGEWYAFSATDDF